MFYDNVRFIAQYATHDFNVEIMTYTNANNETRNAIDIVRGNERMFMHDIKNIDEQFDTFNDARWHDFANYYFNIRHDIEKYS